MKISIIGHTGFIGKYLKREFDKKYLIKVFSLRTEKIDNISVKTLDEIYLNLNLSFLVQIKNTVEHRTVVAYLQQQEHLFFLSIIFSYLIHYLSNFKIIIFNKTVMSTIFFYYKRISKKSIFWIYYFFRTP